MISTCPRGELKKKRKKESLLATFNLSKHRAQRGETHFFQHFIIVYEKLRDRWNRSFFACFCSKKCTRTITSPSISLSLSLALWMNKNLFWLTKTTTDVDGDARRMHRVCSGRKVFSSLHRLIVVSSQLKVFALS